MTSTDAQGLKTAVEQYWDAAPCGTRDVQEERDERARFAELERQRDEREPFIERFARFADTKGKRILEVGVGAGTDFIRFARAGAQVAGVDLTTAAVAMVRRRLELEGLQGDVRQADAEHLPFDDDSFSLVYSWGVIHHTPDTPRAASEIVRVLAPGGRLCVMIYHRYSLVALQAWLRFGALRLAPTRPLDEILAEHVESPGTKAYTRDEARRLFPGIRDVTVTPVLTPYDVRLGRRTFLPRPLRRLVPEHVGWFLVVEGRKAFAR